MRMYVQVSKEHYDFSAYVDVPRWNSYYAQVSEIIRTGARKVMLIGTGDGMVSHIVKKIDGGVRFITVDLDSALGPDICADVCRLSEYVDGEDLPDAIVCCQVLEHLPFGKFDCALKQIRTVACMGGGKVILSLPDGGIRLRGRGRLPKMIRERIPAKLCIFWKKDFAFNGEHYWEVNAALPYCSKNVRKHIQRHFHIEREFHVMHNDYHRFYILSAREDDYSGDLEE